MTLDRLNQATLEAEACPLARPEEAHGLALVALVEARLATLKPGLG